MQCMIIILFNIIKSLKLCSRYNFKKNQKPPVLSALWLMLVLQFRIDQLKTKEKYSIRIHIGTSCPISKNAFPFLSIWGFSVHIPSYGIIESVFTTTPTKILMTLNIYEKSLVPPNTSTIADH